MFKRTKSEDGKCGYAVPVVLYANATSKWEARKMIEKAVSLWPARVKGVDEVIQMTQPGEMFSQERQ